MSDQPKEQILVVDDEIAIRDMVGLALQQAGMACDKAASAHEARSRIEARRPDLILLDWMMPGLSGVDWLRELRRDRGACAVPAPTRRSKSGFRW